MFQSIPSTHPTISTHGNLSFLKISTTLWGQRKERSRFTAMQKQTTKSTIHAQMSTSSSRTCRRCARWLPTVLWSRFAIDVWATCTRSINFMFFSTSFVNWRRRKRFHIGTSTTSERSTLISTPLRAWIKSICCVSSKRRWSRTPTKLSQSQRVAVKWLWPKCSTQWNSQLMTWLLTCWTFMLYGRKYFLHPLSFLIMIFVFRIATRSIALTSSTPSTTPSASQDCEKSSLRPTTTWTESISRTSSKKSRAISRSRSTRMLSCVCPSTESLVMSGRSSPNGDLSTMSIQTTFVGSFKCQGSTTSSRRTSCWSHSKRSSTTFSCRCSKPPTTQASIQSCTSFCNTSLDSTLLMMKASPRIRCSILTCHFPRTGRSMRIHRTLIISFICIRISQFSTTSDATEAWTHSFFVLTVVKLGQFNILCAVTCWLRTFLTDWCCAKFPFSSIFIISLRSESRWVHCRTTRFSWTIIETHCQSILPVAWSSRFRLMTLFNSTSRRNRWWRNTASLLKSGSFRHATCVSWQGTASRCPDSRTKSSSIGLDQTTRVKVFQGTTSRVPTCQISVSVSGMKRSWMNCRTSLKSRWKLHKLLDWNFFYSHLRNRIQSFYISRDFLRNLSKKNHQSGRSFIRTKLQAWITNKKLLSFPYLVSYQNQWAGKLLKFLWSSKIDHHSISIWIRALPLTLASFSFH